MPAFSGKTLWFSALALWLTATPADAAETEEKFWAYDVVHAHIAETYAWQPSDYHLRIRLADPDRVLVYVHHKDDEMMQPRNNGDALVAGGGKSLEVCLSRKTQRVVSEVSFRSAATRAPG
jgi:hypothetical protein